MANSPFIRKSRSKLALALVAALASSSFTLSGAIVTLAAQSPVSVQTLA